jgi:hypothetical protein
MREWRRLAAAVIMAEVVGERRVGVEELEELVMLPMKVFLHWWLLCPDPEQMAHFIGSLQSETRWS